MINMINKTMIKFNWFIYMCFSTMRIAYMFSLWKIITLIQWPSSH